MAGAPGIWKVLSLPHQVLVRHGWLYLPLLLDPEIQAEITALAIPRDTAANFQGEDLPVLLEHEGRVFVAALQVQALVEHYPALFPRSSRERRRRLRERYSLSAELFGVHLDPELTTILFHILPHFLRREGFPSRRRLTEGEVLDLLSRRVPVPYHFRQKAREFLQRRPLEEALENLTAAPLNPPPLPEGLLPAAELRLWWEEAVDARLLAEERGRLLKELGQREKWAAFSEDRLALLLYVAAKGHLEVDGFGFQRLKGGKGYRLWKHTGPYILEDYYGRLYLFPDCRVAIHTFGRLRPFVIDHYKHPFLRRHASGQPICVGPDMENLLFSAPNAIRVLEEGIHTLLYSYDRRRRRGFHALDTLPGLLPLVDFSDLRIPPDHPLVLSGDVKVTNRGL